MTIYVGGYGAGNVGDDLILKSILSQEPSATVVAYGRPALERYHEYVEFTNFLVDPERYIEGHKTLVMGGGGIFWSPEHIQELLIIALAAKTVGCKLQVSRVGLHGFHYNVTASRHLLRLAERVSFREHDSLDLARRHLGCDSAVVEPDYACGMIEQVQRTAKTGKLKVGINIASTRFIDDEQFSMHLQQIYAGIAHQFRNELELYYVPFCSHVSAHNQSDLAKADLLHSVSNGLIKWADFASADDLLGFCAQCDFFIGERFHMHIVAHAMNIPFVPFIHNEQTKYRALAHEYGDVPTYYEFSQAFIMNSLTRRVRELIDAACVPPA